MHGLLVELGEIEERVLQGFPDIKNACALVIEFKMNQSSMKHIVLCLMPDVVEHPEILQYLEQHLPGYMLPWKIMSFDEFPRNSSAKIDRKALTVLVQKACEEALAQTDHSPESSKQAVSILEKECCKIWEKLLGKANIGIDENFFELGGDSLLLTQMTLLVEKQLGVKANFARFLASPTIDALLNGVDAAASIWERELASIKTLSSYQKAEPGKAVLLTGASGHLGLHVLRALLDQTDKQIYLIVRAGSDAQAGQRIMTRFETVFSRSIDPERVCIYSGDLAHSGLGLQDADFQKLCQDISLIIHAAAEVNHVVDYARLRTNNVLASQNLLALARIANCSHFFHISTQFSELNNLPEDYMNEMRIHELSSGYEQSKFMAEILMHEAVKQEYPVTTLRLPLIIDPSDPLLLRQNHFVAFVMKCLRMGMYPDLPLSFAVLATEDLASFIAGQCNEQYIEPRVYNCLTNSVYLHDLFEYIHAESGQKVTKQDAALWREQLIASTPETDPFYKLLPLYTSSLLITDKIEDRLVEHENFKIAAEEYSLNKDAHARKMGALLAKYYANI